jgi:hypothetical protein
MEISGFGGSLRGAFGKRTRSTEMKQVSIGHKKPWPRKMSVGLLDVLEVRGRRALIDLKSASCK